MKRTVALLSFLIAVVLFGTALTAYLEQDQAAPDRRRDGVVELRRQGDAAVQQKTHRPPDTPHFLAKAALAGVAFLMTGGALWGRHTADVKLIIH
ncbi:MAG: hypothetical protein JO182_20665 [Acidobacteriaceae bacterium]|nr:hypothetical protein [Acidobacteriaceae bacterium]